MTRTCEFCGGDIYELARTRNRKWIGCRRCQRSWRENLDASLPALNEPSPVTRDNGQLPESVVRRYVTAAVAVAFAFSVRLALKPFIDDASPFLLFTPAVLISAWYGGVGPAIMATGSAAVLGNHFFLSTIGEPRIEQWDRIALFLLVGALITSLTTVLTASRRRLAEALWREQSARAEAEAADQTKDDFLSLVSHELQTPVAVILGWASSIRKRHLEGHELDLALDAIERNAHIQSRLVQDILNRSRIVTGQLRLETQIVSVSDILRAAVEQLRPTFDRNRVHLKTAIADARHPISADPVRMQQVFTNLLSNAAKFTPPGGNVSIEATYSETTAVVRVRDDGVGIGPEFLPHVFEGFQQDPRTLASTPRGLGVGLSIARHFVERHGGDIRVASAGPGKGTTFTVVLPLQPQPAAVEEQEPADIVPDALRGISILLVDDDADARTLLTQTLEYYGARVLPVASSAEAIRTIDIQHADVLLSDLRMSDQDGFALIDALRSHNDPEVASIPAVSITASRLTEDRQHAIASGYQLHLQKPVEHHNLVSAVLRVANMPRDYFQTH